MKSHCEAIPICLYPLPFVPCTILCLLLPVILYATRRVFK